MRTAIRSRLSGAVAEHVELLVGPVEVAGEGEQLGQAEPAGAVARVVRHVVQGGGDGGLDASRP